MIFYMSAVRRFAKQLWKEPHTVMLASLMMTLLGLPVVTIGISLCVGVLYMHHKEKGEGITLRSAISGVKPVMGRALVMGIVDLACAVACISCIALLIAGRGFWETLPSVVLLYLFLFYLSTAMFRYPVLVLNQRLKLAQVVLCSLNVVMQNMGYVFLYWCLMLLTLMICIASGVGAILLLPGCAALIMVTAWSESLKRDEFKKTQPVTENKGKKTHNI